MRERWRAYAVLATALAFYTGGFLVSHITWGVHELFVDLALGAPFVAVLAAAKLWPSWSLVPIVFAFFCGTPLAVDAIEQAMAWYPVGVSAEFYGQQGMVYV